MTPTYDPTDVTLVSTLGPIRISPTSGLVTTETGGTAQFTVVLAQQPTDNVTIGLSSSNTSAGTVSPARLIFTPSNWNIAQTVTITGVADGVVTPDTAYIITAPAVSTDPAFNGLPGSDVAVINQETETCDLQVTGLRITPATGLEAGSSLVVNWNDSNTGDTAMSGSWVDSIAIQNLTTGKTLLSDTVPYDEQTKGRLGGEASFAQHYAFTLPAGADGTGQLQVTVTVDANNQVYERNSNGTAKQNNSATLTAQSIAVAPDLQPGGKPIESAVW